MFVISIIRKGKQDFVVTEMSLQMRHADVQSLRGSSNFGFDPNFSESVMKFLYVINRTGRFSE